MAVIAAFVLVSPPMIRTDEAGTSTGLVWCAIIAAVVLVTIDAARPAASRRPGLQALVASTFLAVTLLMLLASARGTLVLSSGWPGGASITPLVRDIWQAVRERVPPDALVFTDQTGRDPGLHDRMEHLRSQRGAASVHIVLVPQPHVWNHPSGTGSPTSDQ